MGKTKYFIKSIKYGNYYQKTIFKDDKHFVADYEEARQFASKKLATTALKMFNKKENYEIVAIKCGK